MFQCLFLFSLWNLSLCKPKPHVLMLVIDDLRPSLGSFGDSWAFTPNIDMLARGGVRFTQAYAQQALCAPSRNSLLTGRRPDTLKLYDFYNYWRETVGNFTTLPQYFKENGYRTISLGKVFHPGISSNFSDDWPYSWSQMPFHPSTEHYKESPVCFDPAKGKSPARNIVCPIWNIKELPEETLPDIQILNEAKRIIQNSENDTKPLFLSVGFHKPHIPLKYPAKYLAPHPISRTGLAPERFRFPGMPSIAWNPWTDLREREDIASLNLSFPWQPIPDSYSRKIRQSYYSAVTYIDDLIGQLLNDVRKSKRLADNIIIILFGDHGWSLGEHGLWSKYSVYEPATRVPLIIVSPKSIQKNLKIDQPVELVDIFATLTDLAGLKIPEECPKSNPSFKILCTEGKSLLPLMLSTRGNETLEGACSQYPRPGIYPTHHPNSDKPRLHQIRYMGYSLRTSFYRYIEWLHWDVEKVETDWTRPAIAFELYDYHIDPFESINLANRPLFSLLKSELAHQLRIICSRRKSDLF